VLFATGLRPGEWIALALALIEGADRDGLISPGDTVVESTGGSTGPALALVCRAKGYRALIVMADCFTEERFQLMRTLGAEIDAVASVEGRPKVTAQDIHNMVARAEELAKEPSHYATDQFNNPYITSGPPRAPRRAAPPSCLPPR
jgi:cysteine synthase A